MFLPPELWLKIAWYILIYPDMEEKWKRFSKHGDELNMFTGRYRFPIFGLSFCLKTASALLEIPILGLILRHYLASVGGLTYKEIHYAYPKVTRCWPMHILDSVSPHKSTGHPESRFTSVRIMQSMNGTYRAKNVRHMNRFILCVIVEWRPSGFIGITIDWRDGNPDLDATYKFLNGILPYGMEIRNMSITFMGNLTIFVPTVGESGEVEACSFVYPPSCFGPHYCEYAIDPESIVSRDMLRFRPNV